MRLNNLFNVIIILLVLDVITTQIALNYGTEQNIILVSLSGILNISIIAVVHVTHILAIGLILLLKYLINREILKVHWISYYIVYLTIFMYLFVVGNNLVQLLKII